MTMGKKLMVNPSAILDPGPKPNNKANNGKNKMAGTALMPFSKGSKVFTHQTERLKTKLSAIPSTLESANALNTSLAVTTSGSHHSMETINCARRGYTLNGSGTNKGETSNQWVAKNQDVNTNATKTTMDASLDCHKGATRFMGLAMT